MRRTGPRPWSGGSCGNLRGSPYCKRLGTVIRTTEDALSHRGKASAPCDSGWSGGGGTTFDAAKDLQGVGGGFGAGLVPYHAGC